MFDRPTPPGSTSAADSGSTPPERLMRVAPLDLRQQKFRTVFRGLDRTEVVAFLTEAADDYEHALREIDRLRQDLQRMEGPLCREPLGYLQPVDAVHPLEMLGNRTRLVSLQPPDEVPGQPGAAERLDLGQAFLQEILAEMLDAGSGRGIDCCGALALRNGQKRDGIDISTGGCTGRGDARLSRPDALRVILRTG